MNRFTRLAAVALVGSVALVACGRAGDDGRSVELMLKPVDESEVEGRLTLTALGDARTRVEIDVEPAGNPSMPAHIHPGNCAEMVPQPKYALENVLDGRSTTDVPASLDELLAGGHTLNLHKSNEEMDVSTACVDLS